MAHVMPLLLHEWADAAAQQRPEARALVARDESLDYGELSLLSNRIARMLAESGCRPGDRVCLLLPKSPLAIAAILGIYKTGCIYVPLDPGNPITRLAKIVLSCTCRCVLATAETADKVDALSAQGVLGNRLVIGWLDRGLPQRQLQPQDFTLADVHACPAQPPVFRSSGDSPAHILFTSGSTGEPKGVVITHANVISFVQWAVNYFGMGADDRMSAHSPLHFDLSVFDIFGAQAAGAELHLVSNDLTLLPHKLAKWMRDSRLTQWFSVPAQLNYLCRFDAVAMHDFPALRRLLWCGEVLPTPVLQYWMHRLPHVGFTNLYGPTETTIASSYYTVPHCPADAREPVPIGQACAGEALLVLDDNLQPLPPGHEGGLYISGTGLAQGYWQDTRLTKHAFLTRPGQGGLIYRTGDRARLGQDGFIYFLGRDDQQVKSRGYRIDLGEIEAALYTLDYVREAVVVAASDENFANIAICCAYVNPATVTLTTVRLRYDLACLLPQYMIPSRWLAVSHLPRNANGKVDRRKVKEIFESDETTARKQA